MVRASNLRLSGREFDPRSPHYRSVGTGDGWPSSGGHTISVCDQPSRPTQPPILCRTGNEYRPKCGDALWLGSEGMGSFHSWINVWVAGKTVWSLVNTCHSEHFKGVFLRKGIQMFCLQLQLLQLYNVNNGWRTMMITDDGPAAKIVACFKFSVTWFCV